MALVWQVGVWAVPLLGAIMVPSIVQIYVSIWCGDPTAKTIGRMTLDVRKHMDLLGSVLVPVLSWLGWGVVLGWGKTIPVSKKMLRVPHGLLWVALSGPLSACLAALLEIQLLHYGGAFLGDVGRECVHYSIFMNLNYACIMCLPLYPMPGYVLLESWVPRRLVRLYRQTRYVGTMVLFVLLMTNRLDVVPVTWVPVMVGRAQALMQQYVW